MCRVYELKVSIKPLNSELRKSPRMKGQEDCKSKRRWSTPRKQGLLYQLTNAHINSLGKKQQVRSYMDLYLIPCVYIISISFVFSWNFWQWKQLSLWLVCLFLGHFSSYMISIFKFNMTVFAASYHTSFCHIGLLTLKSLFFPNHRQRVNESIV